MDQLIKATAADGQLRVFAAVTTDVVAEAMRRHDCWPVAAAALGRTMTGALLFAANLKNKESVTIKFKGDGPLGTVTADATAEGSVSSSAPSCSASARAASSSSLCRAHRMQ